MAVVFILVALVLGYLCAMRLVPAARPRWINWLLRFSVGAGLGIGITSCLYFLLRLLGLSWRAAPLVAELALLGVLGWWTWRHRPAEPAPNEPSPSGFRWSWLLALLVAFQFLLFSGSFWSATATNPYGEWDAWSIWNVRGRFLAAPDGAWRNAFSPLLDQTHPDYPLLLSGFLARTWREAGSAFPNAVPIVTAFVFFAAVVGLLTGALAALRGASVGWMGGAVLLATTGFLLWPMTQYSDIPLSLYFLATLVLIALGEGKPRVLAAAGFCAALAAWTKNEGLLFVLVVTVVLVAGTWRVSGRREALRALGTFAAGAAPLLLLVLSFKLFLAPASDHFARMKFSDVLARLVDAGRYGMILKGYGSETLALGNVWTHPILLLAILGAALRFEWPAGRRRMAMVAIATTALMFAGYFFVYVITPEGLEWQIGTSMGRLFAQLWPCALFAFFLPLRKPEDYAIVHEPRQHKDDRKHHKEKAARG